jgi:hypothetical protein
MKILLLGLLIVGFALMFWIIRLSRGLRSEYRPPFGLAGPFWFLHLDDYTANGRCSIAKGACALTLLSFVFVGFFLVASTLPPSGKAIGLGGKELPPDFFATLPAIMFHAAAQLATIGLMLGAGFQLVSSWLNPPGAAQRRNAARLAIYGVGAFLVALAHFWLMKVGPSLLK